MRNSSTRSGNTKSTALHHHIPNSQPGREAAAAELAPRQQEVEGAPHGSTQHPAPALPLPPAPMSTHLPSR